MFDGRRWYGIMTDWNGWDVEFLSGPTIFASGDQFGNMAAQVQGWYIQHVEENIKFSLHDSIQKEVNLVQYMLYLYLIN